MGKHQKARHRHKKTSYAKPILFILVIIITIIVFFVIRTKAKGNKNKDTSNQSNSSNSSVEYLSNIEMPDKIGNYDVLGQIKIEKLEIDKYILNETNDESLELSVTKFELPEYKCPEINEPGNFVIAGHNYQDVFARITSLEIGDTFDVIDKANSRKITYEVYDVYTTYPDDLTCLNQETDGKREVTLITCNQGLVTRCIIKAKEK